MKLILDYKKDADLFDQTARSWAEKIERTKKSQIRNFYDKVLELEQRTKYEDDFDEILPFVKMLNSKVAYAVSRKVASREFEEMMHLCIEQVKTKEDLKTFKLFFEAVLGFYKGRD